jgi:hypothetical protein
MSAKVVSASGNKAVIQIEVEFSGSMLDSERAILDAVNEVGKIATHNLLERFDTNGQPIVMGPVSMTSKGQVECAYQTPYGEVVVARHVYQTSKGGKTFCPLEQQARIILSATPFFAKQLSSKYAEFGARRVINDLASNHGRIVAHTFVQDVATAVAAIAQAKEEIWSYQSPALKENVATVSIGIDGTSMLTVQDGWRQAMVGIVALYSSDGSRLHTTYVAATPEFGKETFTQRLANEVEHVRRLYPSATFVGVADGAKDNWPFLKAHTDIQILDFYHASEYLTKAADAVFAGKAEERRLWLEAACHKLKHNRTGPESLMREFAEYSLKRLPAPRREALVSVITYFKNQKKRMRYANNVALGLPIGSGVTEAACKVIVKQRLGGSGMR